MTHESLRPGLTLTIVNATAQSLSGRSNRFYIVNAITLYRLVAAPVMVGLLLYGHTLAFSWLLPVSFFTDLIDGSIARKWKVTSIMGSKLDSIADDPTILAGFAGMLVLKMWFVKENLALLSVMIFLLVGQNAFALMRYGKMSSFHTYAAKAAAVLQGSFLILLFLLPQPVYPLFFAAAAISILDLVEEIILVGMLKEWKADIKGLYWILKARRTVRQKTGSTGASH